MYGQFQWDRQRFQCTSKMFTIQYEEEELHFGDQKHSDFSLTAMVQQSMDFNKNENHQRNKNVSQGPQFFCDHFSTNCVATVALKCTSNSKN